MSSKMYMIKKGKTSTFLWLSPYGTTVSLAYHIYYDNCFLSYGKSLHLVIFLNII